MGNRLDAYSQLFTELLILIGRAAVGEKTSAFSRQEEAEEALDEASELPMGADMDSPFADTEDLESAAKTNFL